MEEHENQPGLVRTEAIAASLTFCQSLALMRADRILMLRKPANERSLQLKTKLTGECMQWGVQGALLPSCATQTVTGQHS